VKGVQGVTHVVEVTRGVAVVGTNFWSAKKGRDALEVEWDLGPNAKNSTESIGAKLREGLKTPGAVARKAELMGDVSWRERYLKGDPAAVREMSALNQLIAAAAEAA